LGGIFLIPPILRGLRFVLDFGGYIDFVVAHMTQPGWLGVVIADLVDPPSGIILPLILLGLGLIYWDSRRSAVRASVPHISVTPAVLPAAKESPLLRHYEEEDRKRLSAVLYDLYTFLNDTISPHQIEVHEILRELPHRVRSGGQNQRK